MSKNEQWITNLLMSTSAPNAVEQSEMFSSSVSTTAEIRWAKISRSSQIRRLFQPHAERFRQDEISLESPVLITEAATTSGRQKGGRKPNKGRVQMKASKATMVQEQRRNMESAASRWTEERRMVLLTGGVWRRWFERRSQQKLATESSDGYFVEAGETGSE